MKGQWIPLGFHAVPSAFNDRSRSRAAVCKIAKSAWISPSTKGKRMDCDSRASQRKSLGGLSEARICFKKEKKAEQSQKSYLEWS